MPPAVWIVPRTVPPGPPPVPRHRLPCTMHRSPCTGEGIVTVGPDEGNMRSEPAAGALESRRGLERRNLARATREQALSGRTFGESRRWKPTPVP